MIVTTEPTLHIDVVSSPSVHRRVPSKRRRAAMACIAFAIAAVAMLGGIHKHIDGSNGELRDPMYAEQRSLLRSWPEFTGPRGSKQRIAFLGSSRTQLLAEAEMLSDERRTVLNFGCAGCGPMANALYLRRLLHEGLRAEWIVVELHPAMLANVEPAIESMWLQLHRVDATEADRLRSYGWSIGEPEHLKPRAMLADVHTYRMNLLNAYAPPLMASPYGLGLLLRRSPRGYVPGFDVDLGQRWKFIALARSEYGRSFPLPSIGGPSVAALRDTAAVAKQHGMNAMFLLTPESNEFRSWYGEGADGRIEAFAKSLALETGSTLIDARCWLPDDAFADGHHATEDGAKLFAKHMCIQLERIAP